MRFIKVKERVFRTFSNDGTANRTSTNTITPLEVLFNVIDLNSTHDFEIEFYESVSSQDILRKSLVILL